MKEQESRLLYAALCYEEGHPRRTQHILKVYALAQMLGQQAGLDPARAEILGAGAILHDIAIKFCKDRGQEATQAQQQAAAPALVEQFLNQAGYPAEVLPDVLELVLHHHAYSRPHGPLMQLLMEADLIVNCYECPPSPDQRKGIEEIFQTRPGKQLLALCLL